MVLDCVAHGKAGHAARDEGENALYKAMDDINLVPHLTASLKVSDTLGPVKDASVTVYSSTIQSSTTCSACGMFLSWWTLGQLYQYTLEEMLEIHPGAL